MSASRQKSCRFEQRIKLNNSVETILLVKTLHVCFYYKNIVKMQETLFPMFSILTKYHRARKHLIAFFIEIFCPIFRNRVELIFRRTNNLYYYSSDKISSPEQCFVTLDPFFFSINRWFLICRGYFVFDVTLIIAVTFS